MKKYYIGIDGGATNIKAALVDNKGNVIHFLTCPTQNNLGEKKVSHNVLGLINTLLNDKYAIQGIGLAWPGKTNTTLSAEKIKNILTKKYKLAIFSANDADLFTLGESIFGQGKNKEIVLGITLGTGVGSGLIIAKNILATEFGHVSLNPNGPKCKCGNKGCFEEYAGSRALIRLIKKYKLEINNGKELYQLADQKNKKALLLWQEYGQQLGRGLIAASRAYSPDIIILGGNIAQAYKFFAPSMNKEIKSVLKNKTVTIKKSALKNAAVIGAAYFAKQNIK